jgi:predicted nucleotidyltransferase
MQKLNLSQSLINIVYGFIKELKDIYGEGLVAVILYGSAASGEFVKQFSNINLLVVLQNAGLRNLKSVSGLINRRKYRLLRPLFLSHDYIRGSVDVFPVEFLDMKENYVVLAGKDILKDISIDLKNLRFQCEQELKEKLLNIQNIYLRNRSKETLKDLLFKSFNSILHLLRNLIRLKGLKPPYLKQEVLKDFSREFGIDTKNLDKILNAKNGNLRLKHEELDNMLVALVEDLEKIIKIADNL